MRKRHKLARLKRELEDERVLVDDMSEVARRWAEVAGERDTECRWWKAHAIAWGACASDIEGEDA